ncbi:hypothetical protein ACFL6C_07625 [Myxococcota bacterium]
MLRPDPIGPPRLPVDLRRAFGTHRTLPVGDPQALGAMLFDGNTGGVPSLSLLPPRCGGALRRLGVTDLDGVKELQRSSGAMGGRIRLLQAVLREHVEGAHLLDLDLDGKLDAEDLIVTTDASGALKTRELGVELRDHVRIGAAVVSACRALARASPRFGVSHSHQFSSRFWLPVAESGCGAFEIRPGVLPSEAIRDIQVHPKRYRFDCGTAIVVVFYTAMLELLGEKTFNRVCANLEVGPWWLGPNLAEHLHGSGDISRAATPQSRRELRPGDHVRFCNWDVSAAGRRGGWSGENAIYLGNGLYYGHPFGICNEKTIVDHLNAHRRWLFPRSATLTRYRMQLQSSILDLAR